MTEPIRLRVPSYIYFGDEPPHQWGFPDPLYQPLLDAKHKARYSPERLTPADAMTLATFVDACMYLLVDCPTTELAIEKLRAIRRAVNETADDSADD